jgi:hypothetical protein
MLPADNQHIKASQYQLYLPTESQLLAEVQKELAVFQYKNVLGKSSLEAKTSLKLENNGE